MFYIAKEKRKIKRHSVAKHVAITTRVNTYILQGLRSNEMEEQTLKLS
jgi:hypothetical protein